MEETVPLESCSGGAVEAVVQFPQAENVTAHAATVVTVNKNAKSFFIEFP